MKLRDQLEPNFLFIYINIYTPNYIYFYICICVYIYTHTYVLLYQNLVVIKPKIYNRYTKKKDNPNTTLKIIIKSQEKRTKEEEKIKRPTKIYKAVKQQHGNYI